MVKTFYNTDRCWYGDYCRPNEDLRVFISQALRDIPKLKEHSTLQLRRDVYHIFQRKIPLFGDNYYDLTNMGEMAIRYSLPKGFDCQISVLGNAIPEISLFNDEDCAELKVFKPFGEYIKENYQVKFGRIIKEIKKAEKELELFKVSTRPFMVVPSIKEDIKKNYISGLIKSIEITGESYNRIRNLIG